MLDCLMRMPRLFHDGMPRNKSGPISPCSNVLGQIKSPRPGIIGRGANLHQ